MKSWKSVTVVALAYFILLWCDHTENPYMAGRDAGVRVVAKSFTDGDSVSIFSTESLMLALNLKEHVDRVVLRTAANRFWSGNDTSIATAGFEKEPLPFRFSFYDTGWQKISIVTILTSGDSLEDSLSVYARSPLHQAPMSARVGDTILLSTPPVGDDVLYIWDFRDGTVIRNDAEHVSYIVKTPLTTGMGEMYVWDHIRRSPSVHFMIVDNSAPGVRILLRGDSLSGDTVFTGDADFTFRVGVTGTASILTATVNGMPLEKTGTGNDNTLILTRKISGLDTSDNPLRMNVAIVDGTGSTHERTFQIRYAPGAPRTDRPVFHVLIPSKDSVRVNRSSFTMSGYIGNRTGFDSLTVFLQTRDSLHSGGRIVGSDSAWQWTIDLDTGWNTISLIAFKNMTRQGDTLALVRCVIGYTPDERDTIKPELVSLLGNGRPLANGQITADSNLQVKAAIFDNSGSVTAEINGKALTAEAGGVWFGTPMTLVHRTGGTQLHIVIVDKAGNRLDTTVVVNFNRPPVFTRVPPTIRVSVDSLLATRIGVSDPDDDAVSQTAIIRRAAGDTVVMLDTGGVLTWHPVPADTGWHTVMVRAWDGFDAAETTFITFVAPVVMKAIPVRFIAKSTDLPKSLVATEDTLRFELRIDSVSGTPPVRFSAYVAGGPVLLEKSRSAALFWAPAAGDTGIRRIEMIVVDSLGFADTAEALISVVPVHPVSVFFELAKSSGVESVSPQTIRVRLSEPAHRTLTAVYAIDWTKTTADSADFDLPVDRRLIFNPGDTVRDISISIVNNALVEPDKLLAFTLTPSSANAVSGAQTVHVHTIINDDFALRVAVSPDGTGVVTQKVQGTARSGTYQVGTDVELTAKPASGYRIVSWSGPVTATNDSTTVHVRMDSSVTVGALFNMTQPVITVQPINQTVTEGQGTFFSIAASGLNCNYQWQRNGSAINGATGTTYSTPVLTLQDNGVRYRCIVSNPGGSVISREATVAVAVAVPILARQPHDTLVDEGKSAGFSIVATGSGLSYQWQKNGNALSGATLSNYTTPGVAIADSGTVFRCVVTNSAGAVTSSGAVLSVRLLAPSITVQPSSQAVIEGATASFSITAAGSRCTYVWQKNGSTIAGATGPLYTTPATLFTDSGSVFRCIVRNSAGSIMSNLAVLNVTLAPPVVIANPSDRTVNETQSATFTAAIRGSVLQYQWQKNGVPINGATETNYTIVSTLPADSGSIFKLIAVNRSGTVTTTGALLRVNRIPPSITSQPADRQVVEGQTAAFSVAASGSDLTYQWAGSAGRIVGATGATYTTPAVTIADSNTSFRCTVTNPAGSVTSTAAVLSVRRAVPVVTTEPSSITVFEGQPASFSVTVSGTGLSYRWQRGGVDIAGATGAVYLLSATVAVDNSARFRCIVRNSSGSDTSTEALLSVLPSPVLPTLTGPVSVSVVVNASVTFTVTTTGGTLPITYQWQKNSVDLPGETAAGYSIASVQSSQNGEKYQCIVTNPAGSVTSAVAILTIQ